MSKIVKNKSGSWRQVWLRYRLENRFNVSRFVDSSARRFHERMFHSVYRDAIGGRTGAVRVALRTRYFDGSFRM